MSNRGLSAANTLASSCATDPKEARRLIETAGGDKAFAELLGLDYNDAKQRVNNWKNRGIPPAVELEHLAAINRLRKKAGI